MPDTIAILVDNLADALQQLNRYLGLGLISAISALALEAAPAESGSTERIELGGFVPMGRDTAQLVLIGVSFVAGLMASYAAESAHGIVAQLQAVPDVLRAACTRASVATSPVGVPVIGSLLPILFVSIVFVRKWLRWRENGLLGMLAVFAAAYITLAMLLGTLDCRSS